MNVMNMLNKKMFVIIFVSLIMVVLISGCTGQIQTNEQTLAPPSGEISGEQNTQTPLPTSQNTIQEELPPSPPST